MKLSRLSRFILAAATIVFLVCQPGVHAHGGEASGSPKYSPDVPTKITTPDTVETRIGTLHFTDGTPDPATVQLAYDQLDFGRGVDAFLKGMSATSVHALCTGFEEAGIRLNEGIGIAENLLDARSLFLTANTTTVYVTLCIDVKDGPMVVRIPPRVLGPVDDADFRWVTDVGLTGPDKGAGGDYLFVPPGYKGTLPEKVYHIARPRTNRMLMFYRAFVKRAISPRRWQTSRRGRPFSRCPRPPSRRRRLSSTSPARSSIRSAPTTSASVRS
jgi:hypothetical protein